MSSNLMLEVDGSVIRLTLNRPEKRNALSFELLNELESALSTIASHPTARVVVLGATARPSVRGTTWPRWSPRRKANTARFLPSARG